MKSRIIKVTVGFICVLIVLTISIILISNSKSNQEINGEQKIELNDLRYMIRNNINNKDKLEEIENKITSIQNNIRTDDNSSSTDSNKIVLIQTILIIVFIMTIFLYIYFAILRPFSKMKVFAEKIAVGDFNIPLNYERSNYFGAFTWAFDNMRKEIIKARSCEKEAIENNKTVIATLSHDIKTPIASIRAYSEALQANINTSVEARDKYLEVIMKKCDEVAKLTNDLFIHSISDLNKLKVTNKDMDICSELKEAVLEISAEQNDIIFSPPCYSCYVSADKKRFRQIIENIINNSRKYAKTDITITTHKTSNDFEITISDKGKGIPDEDVPFIFNKFYRGKNCGDQQGSGLGLYIVKYLTQQMNGQVELENKNGSFNVSIKFPIIKMS